MTKTWPNVNPRYGPKPVQTDFEAHAVAATAFVVMTYTQKARVKEAEQLGKLFKSISESRIRRDENKRHEGDLPHRVVRFTYNENIFSRVDYLNVHMKRNIS
jgi:hypothetical protein